MIFAGDDTMAISEDDPWQEDLLDRKADADFLEAFLVSRSAEMASRGDARAFVLNIDAEWGAGKTFFLERFGRQLEASGHLVARVDAWKDDYQEDPFIAILASLDAALAPHTKKGAGALTTAWAGVKKGAVPIIGRTAAGVAKTLVKKYVGSEIEEIIGSPQEDAADLIHEATKAGLDTISVEIERIVDANAAQLIKRFNQQTEASNNFRKRLGTAIDALKKEKALPLFVLIDEMDRCRPSYAVSLLERIKHLFDAENTVFVFGTNTNQLKHIISGAYGQNFDGYRYLKRFFDKTYFLSAPSLDGFVRAESSALPIEKLRAPGGVIEFLIQSAEAYNMNLREIRHFIDIIHTVTNVWENDTEIDLVLLAPLAVNFYRDGNTNISHTAQSIPESFTVIVGHRSVGLRENPEPMIVNVQDAFQQSINLTRSLDKCIQLGTRDKMTATQEYLYQTFRPEWDGRRLNRGASSIQNKLPMLVASAGSLFANEDDGV